MDTPGGPVIRLRFDERSRRDGGTLMTLAEAVELRDELQRSIDLVVAGTMLALVTK